MSDLLSNRSQAPIPRRSSTGTLWHERHSNHDDNDDNDSVASEISVEEKILQVVDHVEDEWEERAYNAAVPLEIKLALEHNVFGWSHLSSDILGHCLFTGAAFVVVYAVLSWPGSVLQSLVPVWLRWVLSVAAAASSFRMVRRRRRVWLRAPYGSKSYLQQEAERQREIEQVDQMSWLARMRLRSRQKKVERKLAKADRKFQKQERVRRERNLSNSPSRISPEEEDGGDNDGVRIIAAADAATMTSTTDAMMTPLNNKYATAESPDLSPGRKRRRGLSFSTDPVKSMESVQHDQITFRCGRIQRVPYFHGGGFGAAPFMLANPHWISVLRHLMPDVYVEISRRVQAPPHRLIHWAENNPVVAAYTTAHELEYQGSLPNMEWDVFLDPHLVNRVLVVLHERRTFLLSVLPELPTVRPMEQLPEFSQLTAEQRNIVQFYERELRKRVQLLVDTMLIAHGNLAQLALEQTGYFKHYNYSRVKRTRRTLGGGIYARRWMAVFAESLRIGVLRDNETSSSSPTNSNVPTTSRSTSPPGSSLMDLGTSSCPNTSIAASVAIIKHVVKREEPFGLILDVKSRHVPPPVWACVVDCLYESGVRVEGVGAFCLDDIRSLRQHTVRPVRELLLFHSAGDLQQACHEKKIRYGDTVLFNAGSLLWTPNSEVAAGWTDTCQQLFTTFDAEATKQSYRVQPFALPSAAVEQRSYNHNDYTINDGWTGSTIEDYKRRYNLSIGMYLQEFAIDDAAANLLSQLVNDHPEIYDLGLAWGGVNGVTLRGIRPGRFTDTSGFWNQRHVAAVWDSARGPPV